MREEWLEQKGIVGTAFQGCQGRPPRERQFWKMTAERRSSRPFPAISSGAIIMARILFFSKLNLGEGPC